MGRGVGRHAITPRRLPALFSLVHGVTCVLSRLLRSQSVWSVRVPRGPAGVCCGALTRPRVIAGSSPHFVGGRRVAFVLFTVGVQVEARLALIFLACRVRLRCRVCSSLCGVLRGVESLVCVLGCLRCESLRGARTGRFTLVSGSRGVARFLRRCYCGVWRLAVISRVSVLNW